MSKPYAYQAWHCGKCEDEDAGSGSITWETSPTPDGPLMYCEVCGTGYDERGNWVPDPEDVP